MSAKVDCGPSRHVDLKPTVDVVGIVPDVDVVGIVRASLLGGWYYIVGIVVNGIHKATLGSGKLHFTSRRRSSTYMVAVNSSFKTRARRRRHGLSLFR